MLLLLGEHSRLFDPRRVHMHHLSIRALQRIKQLLWWRWAIPKPNVRGPFEAVRDHAAGVGGSEFHSSILAKVVKQNRVPSARCNCQAVGVAIGRFLAIVRWARRHRIHVRQRLAL